MVRYLAVGHFLLAAQLATLANSARLLRRHRSGKIGGPATAKRRGAALNFSRAEAWAAAPSGGLVDHPRHEAEPPTASRAESWLQPGELVGKFRVAQAGVAFVPHRAGSPLPLGKDGHEDLHESVGQAALVQQVPQRLEGNSFWRSANFAGMHYVPAVGTVSGSILVGIAIGCLVSFAWYQSSPALSASPQKAAGHSEATKVPPATATSSSATEGSTSFHANAKLPLLCPVVAMNSDIGTTRGSASISASEVWQMSADATEVYQISSGPEITKEETRQLLLEAHKQ